MQSSFSVILYTNLLTISEVTIKKGNQLYHFPFVRQDWKLSFTLKIKQYGPNEWPSIMRLGDETQSTDFFQNKLLILLPESSKKKVHMKGATAGEVNQLFCEPVLQENVESNFSISRSYEGIINGKNKWSFRVLKDGVEKYRSSPREVNIKQYNNIKLTACDSIGQNVIKDTTVKNVKFQMDAVGKLCKILLLFHNIKIEKYIYIYYVFSSKALD